MGGAELIASAGLLAVSTASAAGTGDKLTVIVASICNAAILAANCAVSIYRKWRDRDKDLQKKDQPADSGGEEKKE